MAPRRQRTVLHRCRQSHDSRARHAGGGRRAVSIGTAVQLFAVRLASGANVTGGSTRAAQYAVAADGRFLLLSAADEGAAPAITIVQNWTAALKK